MTATNNTATHLISRYLRRTAYARNGNVHNPTRYYGWLVWKLNKQTGMPTMILECTTLTEAKRFVEQDERGTYTVTHSNRVTGS